MDLVTSISSRVGSLVAAYGMEARAFQASWYNSLVEDRFRIPVGDDSSLCVLIASHGEFWNALKAHVCASGDIKFGNPVDSFSASIFKQLEEEFASHGAVSILECEFKDMIKREPKILVQSMGHAAGMARYYQVADVLHASDSSGVLEDYFGDDVQKTRRIGVSVHPIYGGWFTFRGVLVFPNLSCPVEMIPSEPEDVIPSAADRARAIDSFNFQYMDPAWRDCIPVLPKNKYSPEAYLYFHTQNTAVRASFLSLLVEQNQSAPSE